MTIVRIVSGGQTGVDRAALDVARRRGIACGGWCPRGRRAEDGVISSRYPLIETPDTDYAQRTGWNVRDSDATLILNEGRLEGGTRLTREIACRRGRPCLVVDLDDPAPLPRLAGWLHGAGIKVVNVAGPRESGRPGIQDRAAAFLDGLLAVMGL